MANYDSPGEVFNRSFHEVSVGILIDSENRLLLNQRQPHQLYAHFWEFPGGKLNPQETPLEGLCRELHEELGISVSETMPIFCVQHTYPEYTVRLHIFIVEAYEGYPHGKEGQSITWCALDEVQQYSLLPANHIILQAIREVCSSY